MTETAESVERVYRWFSEELCPYILGADRPLISQVDEEMLERLAELGELFPDKVQAIKQGAKQLDWDSDEKREEYMEELDENVETLEALFEDLETDSPVDRETKMAAYVAACDLKDMAAGVCEDL